MACTPLLQSPYSYSALKNCNTSAKNKVVVDVVVAQLMQGDLYTKPVEHLTVQTKISSFITEPHRNSSFDYTGVKDGKMQSLPNEASNRFRSPSLAQS